MQVFFSTFSQWNRAFCDRLGWTCVSDQISKETKRDVFVICEYPYSIKPLY